MSLKKPQLRTKVARQSSGLPARAGPTKSMLCYTPVTCLNQGEGQKPSLDATQTQQGTAIPSYNIGMIIKHSTFTIFNDAGWSLRFMTSGRVHTARTTFYPLSTNWHPISLCTHGSSSLDDDRFRCSKTGAVHIHRPGSAAADAPWAWELSGLHRGRCSHQCWRH
jgi:hypothetical protein